MSADIDNILHLHNSGISILTRKFGPIGMARFVQQFSNGKGDYTKEKYEREDNLTIDELLKQPNLVREMVEKIQAEELTAQFEDTEKMTPVQLQRTGIEALTKELGPDDTARFLEHLEHGEETPCT